MKRIRKLAGGIWRLAEKKLDNISLKKKLLLIYVWCVLFPLVVTDTAIFSIIVKNDRKESKIEMENIADAIAYNLDATVEGTLDMMQRIYSNRYVNEFIATDHKTPLGYYENYLKFLKDSLYEVGVEKASSKAVIYADNPSIINGGYFARLEKVKDSGWYQTFTASGRDILLLPHFETDGDFDGGQKKLSLIRKMDYYHKGRGGDVFRVDFDYSAMTRSIANAGYAYDVYVCSGDKILFSNDGKGGIGKPFSTPDAEWRDSAGAVKAMSFYGSEWSIYVLDNSVSPGQILMNNLPLVLFLLVINIFLPLLFVTALNRSFTIRLRTLGEAFEEAGSESLHAVTQVQGRDEIGRLMQSYNRMASRINELIQTVYKDKLREQEIDIARQRAELLALHSQINPHFLFNALESIRMHSLLKKEYETADMVEKLALMQRQNVEWGEDDVCMEEELRFVEAYLELQKYRFGERLNYRIFVDEACKVKRIPRLSLVTFVENACVHGLEGKEAAGWIFVSCTEKNGEIRMEIEDTGTGMDARQSESLRDKMNHAVIGQLKEKGRVGILNACIRLKMATKDRVCFELESEPGVGTTVTITIPKEEGQKDVEGIIGG